MLRRTIVLLIWLVSPAVSAAGQDDPDIRQAFEIVAPHRPAPVDLGAGGRLLYELHLTNFSSTALSVRGVEALDGSTGRSLAVMSGDELRANVALVGAAPDQERRLLVDPGRRIVVYLDVPDLGSASLIHRVDWDAPGTAAPAGRTAGGSTSVDPRSPPRLGPPLRGGPWVAVRAPDLVRGHRRVVYAIHGAARVPGRHAIDWMRPEGDASGDGAASEVLAVADAVVVEARGSMADRTTEPLGLADAAGNYISLSLGDGRFVLYEHLAPGLLVRRGERVARGQVIGRLGASGQASQAHLHLHVADHPVPLAGESLPYVLEDAQEVGRFASVDAFDAGDPWTPTSSSDVKGMPAPMAVIVFPVPGSPEE